MAYLFFQAAQAERSHFNITSAFHERMYSAMGVGAVSLIVMPVLVARAAAHDAGARARAGNAVRASSGARGSRSR